MERRCRRPPIFRRPAPAIIAAIAATLLTRNLMVAIGLGVALLLRYRAIF
jgi:branched-subunit amino acid transport protein